MMDGLDFDQSGTINVYEFDSEGKTSSVNSAGPEASNLQESLNLIILLTFYNYMCTFYGKHHPKFPWCVLGGE